MFSERLRFASLRRFCSDTSSASALRALSGVVRSSFSDIVGSGGEVGSLFNYYSGTLLVNPQQQREWVSLGFGLFTSARFRLQQLWLGSD